MYKGHTKHTGLKTSVVRLDKTVSKMSSDDFVVNTMLLFNHNTTVRGEQSMADKHVYSE